MTGKYLPKNKDKGFQILVMLAKQTRASSRHLREFRNKYGYCRTLPSLKELDRDLVRDKDNCRYLFDLAKHIYFKGSNEFTKTEL